MSQFVVTLVAVCNKTYRTMCDNIGTYGRKASRISNYHPRQ